MMYNSLMSNPIFVLCILRIMTLYNARMDGWRVKRIGNKRYELSKMVSDVDAFNLEEFMNRIVSLG